MVEVDESKAHNILAGGRAHHWDILTELKREGKKRGVASPTSARVVLGPETATSDGVGQGVAYNIVPLGSPSASCRDYGLRCEE